MGIIGKTKTTKPSFFGISNNRKQHVLLSSFRGGGTTTTDDDDDGEEEDKDNKNEELYLPGLLEAIVVKETIPNAINDSTIYITKSKAKELNIKNNDIVCIVGRRRSVTMVNIGIMKSKNKNNNKCQLSKTLAKNIQIRESDVLKIIPFSSSSSSSSDDDKQDDDNDEKPERSGDYLLLNYNKKDIKNIINVRLSPIQESLDALNYDDDIDDDDILMDRFIIPYIDNNNYNNIIWKKGHVLTMKDDNHKSLDFLIVDIDFSSSNDSN